MHDAKGFHTSSLPFASRLLKVNTVLFDFDGVLFQTMEDHYASWQYAFASVGITVSWEDFARLEGQSFYAIANQLGELYGINENQMRAIAEKKNTHYLQHHQSKPYPDAESALQFFHRCQWNIGLVTGGFRERIERTLPQSWKKYFSVIITADDVQKTKPDPEPYLLAASKMNRTADQCLVIENAPLGIQSALAAGMLCIALTTTLPHRYLSLANWVTDSLTNAIQLINDLLDNVHS